MPRCACCLAPPAQAITAAKLSTGLPVRRTMRTAHCARGGFVWRSRQPRHHRCTPPPLGNAAPMDKRVIARRHRRGVAYQRLVTARHAGGTRKTRWVWRWRRQNSKRKKLRQAWAHRADCINVCSLSNSRTHNVDASRRLGAPVGTASAALWMEAAQRV